MLVRVLEPEVMDTVDDAQSYDQMDHGAVNQQFVSDLLAQFDPSGEILDLGTGTALIPIELCRRVVTVRVTAVDAAAAMLDQARVRVEQAGFHSRIQLRQADAKALPFPSAHFDGVISNSIVHHLADPTPAIAESVRVVRSGGFLFFRDLFRPSSESELQRLVDLYAAGESDYARQLFAQSLRAAFSVEDMRGIVQTLGFASEGVVPTSDRHWTWAARSNSR